MIKEIRVLDNARVIEQVFKCGFYDLADYPVVDLGIALTKFNVYTEDNEVFLNIVEIIARDIVLNTSDECFDFLLIGRKCFVNSFSEKVKYVAYMLLIHCVAHSLIVKTE